MKDLLYSYKQIYDEIKALNDKKIELIDKILDYEFPKGKYQNKKVADVIQQDSKYVDWWLTQNRPESSYEFYKLLTTLKSWRRPHYCCSHKTVYELMGS